MMKLSIKLMTWTMNGSWILSKLERRRVKLYQRVMAVSQCQLSNCEHFLSLFFFFFSFLPNPDFALLCPKMTSAMGSDSTRPELLGTKSIKLIYSGY